MSIEWIFGEYIGTIDIIDCNEDGPWALISAENVDDQYNSPMVQISLTDEQYKFFQEGENVKFQLTDPENGDIEACVFYADLTNDNIDANDIYIAKLNKD